MPSEKKQPVRVFCAMTGHGPVFEHQKWAIGEKFSGRLLWREYRLVKPRSKRKARRARK